MSVSGSVSVVSVSVVWLMALASSGMPSSIGAPPVAALVVDSKFCSEGIYDGAETPCRFFWLLLVGCSNFGGKW